MDYEFSISALKPETLSAVRLAKYLECLSKVLGSPQSIHLLSVTEGSAVPSFIVDDEALPRIDKRLSLLTSTDIPKDLRDASDKLDTLLREDLSTGELKRKGEVVYLFPGVEKEIEQERLYTSEPVAIKGELLKIGGVDDSVPFDILRGSTRYHGNISKTLAMQMAQHLFKQLEVKGVGQWAVKGGKRIALRNFYVDEFSLIEDQVSLVDRFKTERERSAADPSTSAVDKLLSELENARYGSSK